jgi:anthranilate/para-aminobenzoate synthase component I
MEVSRATLDGPGWGSWRGRWTAERWLEGTTAGWRLVEGGRVLATWSSIAAAVGDLWRRRTVTDRAPWLLGWLGYASCARLADHLPAVADEEGALAGLVLVEPHPGDGPQVLAEGRAGPGATLAESLDDAAFAAGVERIRGLIAAGSVYQVNLCRRFTVTPWSGGLRSLLDRVRGNAEPDYLCAMSWGGRRAGELVCASMERVLHRSGRRVMTEPIKGTRRRGLSPEEDRELALGLERDAKERAELAMIVDLERNDLGRVAVPGTVVVEDPGAVRTWARIHHRVARVAAELDPAMGLLDVVRAVVPGGSVTGCPKRAAMRVIAELEPTPRGPFTGAVGVVAGNGDLELALPIRTCWLRGGRLEMAAGCGVVWESEPEREVAESRLKLASWLELVAGWVR